MPHLDFIYTLSINEWMAASVGTFISVYVCVCVTFQLTVAANYEIAQTGSNVKVNKWINSFWKS